MSQRLANSATRGMSTTAGAKVAMRGRTTARTVRIVGPRGGSALDEFETVYRANVEAVTAYFARRCPEPQTVADLTSETFVGAASTFASFDSAKGSPRAWLFGIAAHVYARHCERAANGRAAAERLAAHRSLDRDEIEELAGKIDAERAGRELIARCRELPQLERAAIELVDLSGLTPKEAAASLGVSRAVLRKRLSRARSRLRKEHQSDG